MLGLAGAGACACAFACSSSSGGGTGGTGGTGGSGGTAGTGGAGGTGGDAGAAGAGGAPPIVFCPSGTPLIETDNGPICGVVQQGGLPDRAQSDVYAYLGVPYGLSTAGDMRFAFPVGPDSWTETRDFVSYGEACPSRVARDNSVPMSEDCLKLNVWTPQVVAQAPVLVIFHDEPVAVASPVMSGANLAAAGGFVVVTVEARSGSLGFLSGVSGVPPNLGIQDQQLALEWVSSNAEALGGSAGRVVVMGQGTGAREVGAHLVAPDSVRLFSSAIAHSAPVGFSLPTFDQARTWGLSFENELGCAGLGPDCLRQKTVDQILDAERTALATANIGCRGVAETALWGPSIDPFAVPFQPLGTTHNKSAMVGSNADDGTLLVRQITDALGIAPGTLTEGDYDALLTWLFGIQSGAVRTEFAAFEASGLEVALSTILSEYLYGCASGALLDRVLEGGSEAFGFVFRYSPGYDFWPDEPACLFPAVCSDVETPLITGNRDNGTLVGGDAPFGRGDIELSQDLMRYWSEFVLTGFRTTWTDAPVEWKSYGTPGPQYFWTQARSFMAPTVNERCESFWNAFNIANPTLWDCF